MNDDQYADDAEPDGSIGALYSAAVHQFGTASGELRKTAKDLDVL